MNAKKLENWLCLSGVLSCIFYLLHDVVGALNYPDYNWLTQAVSDLTAINTPSYLVASGLSSVYGLLSCLCCSMLCVVVQKRRNRVFRLGVYLFAVMNWISAIGYSLFPLSESGFAGKFQDIMHLHVVTGLVVALSIISLVFICVGSLKKPRMVSLSICAIAALVLMFCGAVCVNVVSPSYFGLVERFSTYSAVVFTGVLGVFGFLNFSSKNVKA